MPATSLHEAHSAALRAPDTLAPKASPRLRLKWRACCGGGLKPTTTRIQNVRDGAATTFAIGEAVPEWSRHTWWWWFNATTGTCAIPLNYKQEPDLQEAMEGDWWHNYSFLSRHAGGAHFGMVDGSARFVSENINRDVYRALGTIQAEEVVGDDW